MSAEAQNAISAWLGERDESAARELMELLYPQVARIARSHLPFRMEEADLVQEILLVIGRSPAGVRFGKRDQRANLVFLIGVPQRLVSDYLICVGALARIVRNESIRSDLLRAPTREEFVAILRTASSPDGAV